MDKRIRQEPELLCGWDFEWMIVFIFASFWFPVYSDIQKLSCQISTKERLSPEVIRQYGTVPWRAWQDDIAGGGKCGGWQIWWQWPTVNQVCLHLLLEIGHYSIISCSLAGIDRGDTTIGTSLTGTQRNESRWRRKKENIKSGHPKQTGEDPHQSLLTIYSVHSRHSLD